MEQRDIPPCVKEYCIDILLIDDSMVEKLEEFTLVIRKGLNPGLNERITLARTRLQCTIVDTDSKSLHKVIGMFKAVTQFCFTEGLMFPYVKIRVFTSYYIV